MRSWKAAIRSLAAQVIMVHERKSSPLGGAPELPQPGKGKRLAGSQLKVERGFAGGWLAGMRPFEEAIRQDQAAPAFERLRKDGFSASVSLRALIIRLPWWHPWPRKGSAPI